jgi:hypothetical protein
VAMQQPKDCLEAILGINAPWFIKDVLFEEKNRHLVISLGYAQEKARFSFLGKNAEVEARLPKAGGPYHWHHSGIAYYSCQIVSEFAESANANQGIDRRVLTQPGFIGETNRRYTHQLRQQVGLAQLRGLSTAAIAQTLRVDAQIVEEILADIDRTADQYRLAACLPTEQDPIWERVLLDRFHLKTQSFSLKLLLSKLKLSVHEKGGEERIPEAVGELRKFFIAQANALESEFGQLCVLSQGRKPVAEDRPAAGNRLVLPALKNSIWLKLITGKIDLRSANVSLNLLLVRLRHAFQQTKDINTRLSVLNSLREFFKKNARSLKPELVLINKLMNAPEETKYTLPGEQHEVWRRILKDENFIPSSHMAYKLFLSNLRSQVKMNPDPVMELDAARKLRQFIAHNQRSLQQELRMVLRNSYAG